MFYIYVWRYIDTPVEQCYWRVVYWSSTNKNRGDLAHHNKRVVTGLRIVLPGNVLQAPLKVSSWLATTISIRVRLDSARVEAKRHGHLCHLEFYPNGAALFLKLPEKWGLQSVLSFCHSNSREWFCFWLGCQTCPFQQLQDGRHWCLLLSRLFPLLSPMRVPLG